MYQVSNDSARLLTSNSLAFNTQIQTVLGSVISPASAEAAAVAGDAR